MCWACTQGGGRFLLSLSTYPFGVNGRINENKSINQSNELLLSISVTIVVGCGVDRLKSGLRIVCLFVYFSFTVLSPQRGMLRIVEKLRRLQNTRITQTTGTLARLSAPIITMLSRSLKSKPEQGHLNHPMQFTRSIRCAFLDIPLLSISKSLVGVVTLRCLEPDIKLSERHFHDRVLTQCR
jgi:hypothetical protein